MTFFFNYLVFFILALIFNMFIYRLIYLGVGGSYLKVTFNSLIEKNSLILIIYPFLVFCCLLFALDSSLIYLEDDKVAAIVCLDKMQVEITGSMFSSIASNF